MPEHKSDGRASGPKIHRADERGAGVARECPPPVIVTATAHLEMVQLKQADHHFYLDEVSNRPDLTSQHLSGMTFFSRLRNTRSVTGPERDSPKQVLCLADESRAALLIEADGSRRHPLKAPAAHEPPIPDFVDTVVVVTDLSALGKPCTAEWVHRPEIHASLSGLQQGEEISVDTLERVLSHPSGGLKNISSGSRRVALLNQADTPELRARACELAGRLLSTYHSVVVASLKNRENSREFPNIHAVYEFKA